MTAGRPVGRVVVVGDLVTDVVAALSSPLATGSDTPAQVRMSGGGQGANTASWLAGSGVPVTLVATVGDDSPGRQRLAELRELAGLDLAVRLVAAVPTGAVVVLSRGDERTMITDRGAAAQLRPADVESALARPDVTHLHLSGYALVCDGARAAARHALDLAHRRGLTTSVDAASAAPLARVGAEAFLEWIRGVDLLLANNDEVGVLSGAGGRREPNWPTARAVVCKEGSAGARWLVGDREVARVDAVAVQPVDPTGAGDAFAAGLLAAWLGGAAPAQALAAGATLGALAVGRLGARG